MILKHEIQHVDGKEVDYVLGLLPGHEQQAVDQHIALCERCRMVVDREKLIGVSVKQTLMKAGALNEKGMRIRRPLPSTPSPLQRLFYRGQRQFLIAGFMIFLVVASVGLQLKLQGNSLYATTPAITSTTMLMTDTPTITAVATSATGWALNLPSPTPDAQAMISLPEAMLAPEASSPIILVTNRLP